MSTIFQEKAPAIMRDLMREFDLDELSAAAILGNLGHESGGFRFLQEKKPLIPGSKGGYGWAQWTGPRRRAYEAWCAAKGADPASDDANLSFLVHELRTSEKKAIPAVKMADDLEDKVKAFELAFERASFNHKGYASRNTYAALAYAALTGKTIAVSAPVPPPRPKTQRVWAEELLSKEEIEYAQKRLLALGYNDVGLVDGLWPQNGKVSAAVKVLQARAQALGEKVTVDGHYGPQTRSLLDPVHGRRYAKVVSAQRARTTESDLAKIGTPGVVQGRQIRWASLFGLVGSLIAAAVSAYNAPAEMPAGSFIALAFLPPWVQAVAPFLLTFIPSAITLVKGSGLISTSVERFREGIDNTGLPPASEQPDIGAIFGRIFTRR